MERILVIGYGNPGRLDDGLGPALAEALAGLGLAGLTVESNYQLTVEDAVAVADHDAVVFVDAAVDGPEPFSFRALAAADAARVDFSSHRLAPAALLALARDLFAARADAYVLGVRGYVFDAFGEELSAGARANLAAALRFLAPLLRERRLAQAAEPDMGATTWQSSRN